MLRVSGLRYLLAMSVVLATGCTVGDDRDAARDAAESTESGGDAGRSTAAEPTTTVAATGTPTPAITTPGTAAELPLPTAPTTTATTTHVEGEPCSGGEFQLRWRSGELVCVKTPSAHQWLAAPFSTEEDVASYLPDPGSATAVDVPWSNLITVAAAGPVDSENLWCFWTAFGNPSGHLTTSFSTFEFQLLDNNGALSLPVLNEHSEHESGQLAPQEIVEATVCFNRPGETGGRFGLVFWPDRQDGRYDDLRALFYFDR